ncbi:MAG: hypothetical protein JO360_12560 [Acidobacteria bacterium]|nr:hypothetical protein [Acidobacteriota bacterium]
MKKAMILLFLFGASTLALSLFGAPAKKVWAHIGAPAPLHALPAPPEPPEPPVVNAQGFDIEVLINGIPLPEYYARGRSYVEAQEGIEYELRIRNPLGVRVAAALAVDGLNTIDARRTSAANASKWVIEPYGTITISGWQMSSARARHFYFTTERESYGAKLGQTSNLGVISAVFFRERRPAVVVQPRRGRDYDDGVGESADESRAPAPNAGAAKEPSSNRSSQSKSEAYPAPDDDYAATGIGRNVRHDVRWINLDLEDRATAEVTLRYEFRAALVRLGVNPRPYPYPDPGTLRRRERARGFEDSRYSPEP